MNKTIRNCSIRAFLGIGTVLFAVFALANLAQAEPKKASEVANLASASGTVTGAKPFTAAKVYLKNTDKRILYMVYTNGGKFQAMHLLPGTIFPSTKYRADYDSEGKAVMMIEDDWESLACSITSVICGDESCPSPSIHLVAKFDQIMIEATALFQKESVPALGIHDNFAFGIRRRPTWIIRFQNYLA